MLSLERKGGNHTEWNFELRPKLNRLVDLHYVIRGGIVQKPFKMKDENRWKRLDLHLLACLARVGLIDPHGLGLRDECECLLNGVHRIGLRKKFGGKLVTRTYLWKEQRRGWERTQILSRSDRQLSKVMTSE